MILSTYAEYWWTPKDYWWSWEKEKGQQDRYKQLINYDGKDCNIITGFPVVSEYNYLGVLIDSKMRPGDMLVRSKPNSIHSFKRIFLF